MTQSALQWWVYRASLEPARGSEQGGTRPVLVVSRQVFNKALPMVGVLPLTARRPGRRIYPTEVLLPVGAAGQPAESIVMAHQVRTISSKRLEGAYGELQDPALRSAVRDALRIFLDLD